MRVTGSSIVAIALSTALLSAGCPISVAAQSEQPLNFKIYNPDADMASDHGQSQGAGYFSVPLSPTLAEESAQLDTDDSSQALSSESTSESVSESSGESRNSLAEELAADRGENTTETATTAVGDTDNGETTVAQGTTLKGYVRVVPTGTKVPIIVDTAIDSDTSQEGDEFSARTSEDLLIDGNNVVPAGSIIKGRIAQINTPRNLNRSGSIALKFDTITTPDNRQIPLVATLVARKGVVHARRGMKDIAFDTGAVALPVAVGLGIGAVAGGSNNNNDGDSGMSRGSAAMIGAGVGLAVGLAVLLAKKGKKVDVRPGDELKIELAEDLRMPLM